MTATYSSTSAPADSFAVERLSEAFSGVPSIVWAFILVLFYFAPALHARSKKHHNAKAIFVLNLLLGWTVIGWAVAMVWACTVPTPPHATA